MKKTQTKVFANLVGSIIFIVGGIWAWMQTTQFKTVNNTVVQPAMFPQIMIVGLEVFAIVLFIQSVIKLIRLKPDDPAMEQAESIDPRRRSVQAALVVIVLCVLFVAGFKTAGYVICGAIVCFLIMLLIGKRNWLQMVLVSVLVPLGMYIIFYKVLTVNIPMGPLTFVRNLLDMI